MIACRIIFRKDYMAFHIIFPKHTRSDPSLISMINYSGLSSVVTDTFGSQIAF